MNTTANAPGGQPTDAEQLRQLILDPMQKHVEPAVGALGHCRAFAKTINEAERTIEFVCSTGEIDRYGERVLPSAFRGSLDTFLRNPAFPYGHSYDLTPGGALPTVGHWRSMRVTDDALIGVAYFKEWGLGEEAWRDYLAGNLTSVSVAFLTRAWEMRQEAGEDGAQRRVRVFTDVDLLEVSAVLIPANPSARIRAASASAGLAFDGRSNELQTAIDTALSRSLAKHLSAGSLGFSRHAGPAAGGRSPARTWADEYLSGDLDLDELDQDAGREAGGDDAGEPASESEEIKAMFRSLLN